MTQSIPKKSPPHGRIFPEHTLSPKALARRKISTIKIASNKPGNKRQICRGGFDKIFQLSQKILINPPHPTNILG